MSVAKDLGVAIAAKIEALTHCNAYFSFIPSYNETAGTAFIVSPVSSSYEKQTRDGGLELLSYQAVLVAPVSNYSESEIDSLYYTIEQVKDNFPGGFVSTVTTDYYITAVSSSGTTALSSSEIEGGFIDSKQLGESCLFQSPLIIELIRYK